MRNILFKLECFYYDHIHYQTRPWHFWRWLSWYPNGRYSSAVFYTPLGDLGINDYRFKWFYIKNDFDIFHIQFLWFSYCWYWSNINE